jgi:rod shape determining protein RodA
MVIARWKSTVDWSLIAVVFSVLALGVLTVMSATHVPQRPETNLYLSQLLWVGIGTVVMLTAMLVPYRYLMYLAYPLYGVGVALLAMVLVQGHAAMGARRWLALGGIRFQPSELMKLLMMLALARYFHFDRPRHEYGLRELIFPIIIVAIPFGFIVVEPDLGTAMLLAMSAAGLFLFMRIKRRTLITLAVLGFVAAPLGYQFLKPYQKDRVKTFVNPFSDPHGAGYNSIQSMIAVGSGQFLGKGFKKGTQAHLDFIPEHHTDFIFSVFAEEHGFVGGLLLLSLYLGVLLLGLRAASLARDRFGMFLGLGIVSNLFFQMCVNICMVTGLLPVVGVPLPFVSYGGTNMLFSMASVGILLNLSFRRYTF